MNQPASVSHNLTSGIAFGLYDLIWSCVLPWLRLNHRLAEGYQQRRLNPLLPAADIWIQAASVGESYLALEIIAALRVARPVRILMTANTSQGIDILNKALAGRKKSGEAIDVRVGYFPFDKPALMRRAVAAVRPAAMVLLETEIWPGLLRALDRNGCKTVIINGRLTVRSLKRYLLWPSIWSSLRPHRVLAVSTADADRFKQLFGPTGIEVMPNIKFDSAAASAAPDNASAVMSLVPAESAFVVMASVRRQEEPMVKQMVIEINRRRPDTVIGLFPRHLHRIQSWQHALNQTGIPWSLRSSAGTPAAPGSVIIWDTFGELMSAFQLCHAAFVGGSLAPLGGQNFLEALRGGARPVIGPFWENFKWVGPEIIATGLLQVAADWQEAAALLLADIADPPSRDEIIAKTLEYLQKRRGGTARACQIIASLVDDHAKA